MMSFWVVPESACGIGALAFRRGDVEREQPGGRRVDRHRGVHPIERDSLEERLHVLDVRDRHADLADFAARERVIRVVSGLGGQVEGDREARLPLREVEPVQLVAGARGRMTRVGAEDPGRIAAGEGHRGPHVESRKALGKLPKRPQRANVMIPRRGSPPLRRSRSRRRTRRRRGRGSAAHRPLRDVALPREPRLGSAPRRRVARGVKFYRPGALEPQRVSRTNTASCWICAPPRSPSAHRSHCPAAAPSASTPASASASGRAPAAANPRSSATTS